jgi:cytochrome c peroxidase
MPFELGLRDERDLLERLDNIDYRRRFEAAFPDAPDASMDHVEAALASYLRSLANDGTRPRETSRTDPTLDRRVAMGKRLFFGKAQCVACHEASADSGRYTDDRFHPSALGTRKLAAQLPQLVPLGMSKATDVEAVGRLSGENRDLAELGRFLVDKQPAHVNAFRTPSLLNVAATAPYMHDGSVATLEQAVDLEIYYRGLESGRPLQLTSEERTELVFFLKTLRTP